VLDLIEVDLPRPRTSKTINEPRFAELTDLIRGHIYEPNVPA
jgi:NitT/TauT family transport system ATP-binding protein